MLFYTPFWGMTWSREDNAGNLFRLAVIRKQKKNKKRRRTNRTQTNRQLSRNPTLLPATSQPGPCFFLLASFPGGTGESWLISQGETGLQRHVLLFRFAASPVSQTSHPGSTPFFPFSFGIKQSRLAPLGQSPQASAQPLLPCHDSIGKPDVLGYLQRREWKG